MKFVLAREKSTNYNIHSHSLTRPLTRPIGCAPSWTAASYNSCGSRSIHSQMLPIYTFLYSSFLYFLLQHEFLSLENLARNKCMHNRWGGGGFHIRNSSKNYIVLRYEITVLRSSLFKTKSLL